MRALSGLGSICSIWFFAGGALVACGPVDPVEPGIDGGALDAALDGDVTRPDRPRTPDAGPPADLDGYVQHFMSAEGIAGVGAAIVTRDGIAWTGTWGMADIEAGRPVDTDSLFTVASVSKTVTTVLVMELVEEGLLDLDAPVDDYLPYAVRHPSFPMVPVTARMLLTHTSGLYDDFLLLGDATYQTDPPVTLGDFAREYVTPGGTFYADTNWSTEPGTHYDYCNANFALLGHLVEVLRGEDMRAVTQARVFDALGMAESGWFLSDVDPSLLVVPYSYNGRMNLPNPQSGYAFYPASSLRTSVTELGFFLEATLRDGELGGMRILEEATAQSMRERQIPDIYAAQAITWRYRTMDGETWLAHTGAGFGMSAIIAYQPDTGVGILVLTNSDGFVLARLGLTDAQDAIYAIIDRIANESRAYR